MRHQHDDPNTPTPAADHAERDRAAAVATRPRRRWIPATAIVGGALVTVALTGAGIANAADEGGTPTGSATGSSAPTSAPSSSGQTTEGAPDAASPVTPPSGAGVPAPPAVGALPAAPAGGPGGAGVAAPGGPAADGSTRVLGVVTAIDDSGITVRTDAGAEVTATLSDATHYRADPPAPGADPSNSATTKPEVGQRVELRVLDGAALDAGVVHAHADGTVLSFSGTSAVLSSREGLHVTLDLSASDATVAVGDQVHADGAANSDGSAIVVSSLTVG